MVGIMDVTLDHVWPWLVAYLKASKQTSMKHVAPDPPSRDQAQLPGVFPLYILHSSRQDPIPSHFLPYT